MRRFIKITICLALLISDHVSLRAAIITNAWVPVFKGVDYTTGQADTSEPRQQKVFAFRVDLQEPTIQLFSTPSNGTNALETTGQTTTTFVNTYKVAIGINANFFSPVTTIPNDPRDLSGLAICTNDIVSGFESIRPSILFTRSNQVSIITSALPNYTNYWTAVSGSNQILINGVPQLADCTTSFCGANPRSAVGYSKDKRYLIIMVIDGRQTGWSDGATLFETAQWLLRLGAWNGLNLDGGGSTALAMLQNNSAVLLNKPSGGVQRVDGNHLGVFALPIIAPVIHTQPTNRTVPEHSDTTFTVAAAGTGTLHYQWTFDQTNIAGATQSSYAITNVQMTQAGLYSVVVSDDNASTSSAAALLSVQIPLVNAPGSVVAPPGLVNWWPADGSVNDIYGTLNSAPIGNFSYAPGMSGLAFYFDGSTAMLTNTAPSIAVPWTLSLWLNRSNTPMTSALLVGDGTYALKLEQYNGTHQVGLTILGVGDYLFNPVYTVPVGAWTHLTFVGTSTGTTLYANGVLKGALPNSIPLPRKYWGGAYITSSAKYVDFMQGSLDEIMIFNRALSASEIQTIYLAGTPGLVRAPEMLGARVTGDNQVTVSLQGQTGKNFTVYSSTNLVDWLEIGTLDNSWGTNQFSDNTASGQKFYRATQPY